MSFSTPAALKARISTVKAAQLSAESGDVPDDTAIQAALNVGYRIIRTELSGVVAPGTSITDVDDIAMLAPVEEALALAELYGIRRDVQIRTAKTEIDIGREWAMGVLERIRSGVLPVNSSTASGFDIRYPDPDLEYDATSLIFTGRADL